MFNQMLTAGGSGPLSPPTVTSGDLNASSPWYTIHWTNFNSSWQTRVYRSVNGGSYTLLTTLAAGVTSYSDPTANTYEDNSYHLTHYDGVRESANFGSISFFATTINLTTVGASNIQAGSCPGGGAENSISWSWTGNSTGYTVEIEVDEGSGYSPLASGLGISSSPYTHDLTPLYQDVGGVSKSYTYRVSAKKSGISAFNSPKVTTTINLTLASCGV